MTARYQATPLRRGFDRIMAALGRRGVAPGGIASLTVTGRRSGAPRTVPVTPIRVDDALYLVAPYGEVDWVRNLRAASTALLERGRTSERIRARALDAHEAAPVLRAYVRKVPIVQPFVDAAPDADVAAFEAIAAQHPVFAVTRVA